MKAQNLKIRVPCKEPQTCVATAPSCVATAPSPSCKGVACVATAPSPSHIRTETSSFHDAEGGVATHAVATQHDAEGGVATHAVATQHDAEASFPTHFPGGRLAHVDAYEGNLLPHWTVDGTVYHICFRLFDSVPSEKLKEWETARAEYAQMRKSGVKLDEDDIRRLKYLYSEKVEKYLDAGAGSCLLRNDAALGVVRATLLHDNGRAYRLHAYGIMPNHVHVAVSLRNGADMKAVVGAWKSVCSHRINRLLGRKGELWQPDYYNHIIRTEAEYRFQISYIFGNDTVEAMRLDKENPICRRAGRVVMQSCTTMPNCVATACVATAPSCVATAPSPSRKEEGAALTCDAEGGVATHAVATQHDAGGGVATQEDGK